MKTIKSLGITVEQLYNEEKQIQIHFSDKDFICTLVLVGRDKTPDFLLSSFKGNFYCRTNKGMNREKYTTLKGIEKAVKKLISSKVDTKGQITFSLSNDISYF
jgi:hypothetical protein